MEIIIGRKPDTNQLKIAVGKKEKVCGAEGSVPASVSRAHCSLTTDDSGGITMKNLNPLNDTFVSGVSYDSCAIKRGDRLELGAEHYEFNWDYVAELFPVTVDIRPLKKVWNNYQSERMNMQIKERRFNAISRITGVLTMGAAVLPFIGDGSSDGSGARMVLYGFAIALTLAITIYSVYNASRMPKKNIELDEKFRHTYVCPNEKCHHFMGNQPYDVLAQGKACPHCKAQYAQK